MDRVEFVPWGHLDRFFEAVVPATEEAVVNALVANEEMVGYRGRRTPSLPRDRAIGASGLTSRTKGRQQITGHESLRSLLGDAHR